jgi:hypothetical protein
VIVVSEQLFLEVADGFLQRFQVVLYDTEDGIRINLEIVVSILTPA